ncbi:hypothetical protein JIG36_04160 [Actinoplanes sp. LDG1-06]|uniref:Uncharacterized protein n=1 Tax=Paractinoplanes ovalisporus TaxID=2810368 RepID=A0ABS2A4I4_9ACTN|nr:hypothetical protein [Actinoplanes ovalisporus]MBM2614748.1 hypothetical protein [Actinoplanes ovalisporus]
MGTSPRQRVCRTEYSCPAFFFLKNGNIGAIGKTENTDLSAQLKNVDASKGPDETFVVFPREVYHDSVIDYLGSLPRDEATAIVRPVLKKIAGDLLREWTESLRMLIAAWMERLLAAPAFA